jgi:hypothetical protein
MQMQQQACVDELKAFVRGGRAGLWRLAEVCPSILTHFQITDSEDIRRVMYRAGVPERIWRRQQLGGDARGCAAGA